MSKIRHIDFSPKLRVKYVSEYSQWGYGYVQKITLKDLDEDVEVHYSLQESGGTAVVVKPTIEDNVITVEVPNFLFAQESLVDYKAYGFIYSKGKKSADTVKKIIMHVDARPRPENYVYEESDVKRYDNLDERMKILEEKGVNEEVVGNAVKDYLAENPLEIEVDSALSGTSENPVQNKVVKAELDKKLKTDWGEEYDGAYIKVYNGIAQPVNELKPRIEVDYKLNAESIAPIANKPVAEAINQLSVQKADKAYVVAVFEELKTLIQNGQTDSAIAVLDKAILDLSKLA